ncbi:TlpA family protein disulfide reductase [Hymenobacter arizonensis]|uniref:Thiol-disulfide isomerase or thioredoxin n=1 Tax=Hymenobacter arizonensis TaxID=1227077 RepID=A0A1I5ZNW8_HYMAR|nr:TlpA disulfide reductase family protein [Hymenobacter arizonensis]SFQ58151.1 Thiol-disulfide isomerase or thioredoxin [Hymenobacter arizonensis]
MKNFYFLFLLGGALGLSFCSGDNAATTQQESPNATAPGTESNRQFTVNSAALQKDFTTWWNYTYYNVKLSQDFMGLDTDSMVIRKADFLSRLTSGRVVPFKIMVRDDVTYYRLYPINESQPSIRETIKQKAASEIEHYEKEGQLLPAYQFTDITGKTYSPASTKGKVVVLKFWYIGCVACVQEFPEVNRVVDRYKGREDILFVSLAFDDKEALVNFLQGHELKYATVPNMQDFLQFKLGISSYPTHILLDRAGKIVKVVDRIDELAPFLEKQALATSL